MRFCSILFVLSGGARKHQRWSKKHNRTLTGAEMLAVMGMPVVQSLADCVSCSVPNLGSLSRSAKAMLFPTMVHRVLNGNCSFMTIFFLGLEAQLSGNGMDVPCVGFMILCVELAC